MSEEAVGIMNPAFFVGRKELLSWLNDLLGLSYEKVEQCVSGVAYCQILDFLSPGSLPLHKLNWNARLEHECLKNYKILQTAFVKAKVNRQLDVEKLIKGRYQDHLQQLQFFHFYFQTHYAGHEYNAMERRQLAMEGHELGPLVGSSSAPFSPAAGLPGNADASGESPPSQTQPQPHQTTGNKHMTPGSTSSSSRKRPLNANNRAHAGMDKSASGASGSAPPVPAGLALQRTPSGYNVLGGNTTPASASATPHALDRSSRLLGLRNENAQLLATIDALEKERDYYFSKLREIEEALQQREASRIGEVGFMTDVSKILYEDDGGAPEDENQLSHHAMSAVSES